MSKGREGGAREGDHSPSRKGGLGGLPLDFFLNLIASMGVFNVFFMRLGTDFSHDLLLENIFLGE